MPAQQSSHLSRMDFSNYYQSPKCSVLENGLHDNKPLEVFEFKLEKICDSVVQKAKVPVFEKLSCDELSILILDESPIRNQLNKNIKYIEHIFINFSSLTLYKYLT
jgi:hypothetical protein